MKTQIGKLWFDGKNINLMILVFFAEHPRFKIKIIKLHFN